MELENLIIDNTKLIYSIMKYFKNYNSKEDLFQAGCLGLVDAYKKFNPNMGCKFTTYAYPYILGEMRKLVREDKGIKISRQISKLNLKIEKASILLSQKLMRQPSIDEIADFLEIPSFYVAEAINSMLPINSMDEVITSDSKDLTLQDIVGYTENVDDLIMLKDELKKLNSEEFSIINNRYMNDLTQSETSKIMGISQVQVSRKEQKVLKKINSGMAA